MGSRDHGRGVRASGAGQGLLRCADHRRMEITWDDGGGEDRSGKNGVRLRMTRNARDHLHWVYCSYTQSLYRLDRDPLVYSFLEFCVQRMGHLTKFLETGAI